MQDLRKQVLRVSFVTTIIGTLFLIHHYLFPTNIGESHELFGDEINLNDNDWSPYNTSNPFVDSWCPNANCYNSPLCLPCQHRFLFLVGTGRAGSTSLLRMFNELPKVRLAGENYDEFHLASKLSSNLFNHEQFNYDRKEDGPFFHNSIPKGSFGCVMQDLLGFLDPPPLNAETSWHVNEEDEGSRILGMKTIRLHHGWKAEKAVEFFRENFPCSRFIVNIRSDVESQVESMNNLSWNTGEEAINEANEFYKNFADKMGGHAAKLIDLTEWKDDVEILNDVVAWLGFKDCSFTDIYHENSKQSGGYGRDQGTEIELGSNCTLL